MDQSNIVIETRPQYRTRHEGDDLRELPRIGVTALFVKRVVLDEVRGDVGVEGAEDVLVNVEALDEGVEDSALNRFGGGAGRTLRGAGVVVGGCWMGGAGVERSAVEPLKGGGSGEEEGKGGEGYEEA